MSYEPDFRWLGPAQYEEQFRKEAEDWKKLPTVDPLPTDEASALLVGAGGDNRTAADDAVQEGSAVPVATPTDAFLRRNVEHLEAARETIDILSDPETMTAIQEGEDAIAAGDVYPLETLRRGEQ